MHSFQHINPTDLRDYVVALGWDLIEEAVNDRLYVLNSDSDDDQIAFPMDDDAPDYEDSVAIAIRRLSRLLGRNTQSLVMAVKNVRSDVLSYKLRIGSRDTSIPFDLATRLFSGTEKMLKASAATVLNPRRLHPRLGFTDSQKLIEESQLEQTEAGSFVINISCRVEALDVQGTLDLEDNDAPFVRKVFVTAEESARKIVSAIETNSAARLIEEMKTEQKPLVSSNFCEALSSVLSVDVGETELSFRWAPTRYRPASRPLKLKAEYAGRVEEIRKELRQDRRETTELYIGTVERLDGDVGPDGRRAGTVVLALLLRQEDEVVRARVVLDPDQYEKADRAHMAGGAYIQVVGRLLPGRQPRQLVDIQNFEPVAQPAAVGV